mgnify:CR=1 FL=1
MVITLFVLIKSAIKANKENKEIDPVSPPENNKDDQNNKEVGDKQTNRKK